ncbi:MAG: hypothetical protein Kow0069_26770 [Promethearchaeota archaeon]
MPRCPAPASLAALAATLLLALGMLTVPPAAASDAPATRLQPKSADYLPTGTLNFTGQDSLAGDLRLTGEGTAESPYFLVGREFSPAPGSDAPLLFLGHFDAHLVVRDCRFVGAGPGEASSVSGAVVVNASGVRFENCRFERLGVGVTFENFTDGLVASSTFVRVGLGVAALNGSGLVVADNSFLEVGSADPPAEWGSPAALDARWVGGGVLVARNAVEGNASRGTGLTFSWAAGAAVTGNRVDGVAVGVECGWETRNFSVTCNVASNCSQVGFRVYSNAAGHRLTRNVATGNLRGLHLLGGGNLAWNNTFAGNAEAEARDDGHDNAFHVNSTGNYWGDYEVRYPDQGNDGRVWDRPYDVPGTRNAADEFPLVHAVDACPAGESLPLTPLPATGRTIGGVLPSTSVACAVAGVAWSVLHLRSALRGSRTRPGRAGGRGAAGPARAFRRVF